MTERLDVYVLMMPHLNVISVSVGLLFAVGGYVGASRCVCINDAPSQCNVLSL